MEKLANKKSAGPDSIPQFLLKKLSVPLAIPLTIIFNKSFIESKLPSLWLEANVTPIFKNKGSSNDPSNYRPISLTCIPCKLMESVIRDVLYEFIKPKIFRGQHGFQAKKSTVSQLLETFNDWVISIDRNKIIDVLYIDFAKAFDTVNHRRLILKLKSYGVEGNLLRWLEAFLTNRKQSVVVEGVKSDELPVLSGVPQGSVLGPLLFLIFINDLPKVIRHSFSKIFADDYKLYMAFDRVDPLFNTFQQDIDNLVSFSETNQLRIAYNKCGILHLGYKNPNHTYYFNQTPINDIDSIRDLGILMNNDLKFNQHFKNMCSSANIQSNLIYKCFYTRRPEFLTQMFKVFVRPKLEYASSVWNPSYLKDIDLIEQVQRRFTKRIPGMSHVPYTQRLEHLELESLELRRIHIDLHYVYKLLNQLVDSSYQQFFETTNLATRNNSLPLRKPWFNKDVYKHSFAVRVVDWWNKLPKEVVTAKNLTDFKRLLISQDFSEFVKGRGLKVSK